MSTLPAAGYLNSAVRTEGEAKTALEDFLASVKQIPGAGVAETTLTIASGSVTPPSGGPGVFSIDTEAAAALDDLANIVQTNIPDGSMIMIRNANAARTVNVLGSAGGAGQLSLAASQTIPLSDTKQWILFKRTGTLWTEILSSTLWSPTIKTGLVTADPLVALGISSKQYVDQRTIQAGALWGCTMSNNVGDATNDLDFTAGEAASNDALMANRVSMNLAAITKQLDAAWAVGNNAGGRMSAAAIANGTYHVWVIQRPDTGVVDLGFDVSATAPTMPTNYTKKRRIASFLREGGVIVPIYQDGDVFMRKTSLLDINATNPGTAAVTATLAGVPTGVVMEAIMNAGLLNGTTSNVLWLISALAVNDAAPSGTAAPLGMSTGSANHEFSRVRERTNTSSQIRYRIGTSGAADVFRIATLGWIDTRGRLA